jgi:Holliday junction resolvase RusA-like endonuclease
LGEANGIRTSWNPRRTYEESRYKQCEVTIIFDFDFHHQHSLSHFSHSISQPKMPPPLWLPSSSASNPIDLTDEGPSQDNFEFFVPLEPVPMARPRRGASGKFYCPSAKAVRDYRSFLSSCCITRGLSLPVFPSGAPVELRIIFRKRRPNSHFVNRCRQQGLRSDAPSQIHVGRPDLDNLEKLVMDAATSVLYEDDSQVYFKTSMRLWAEEDGSGSSIVKIRSSPSGPNLLHRT